MKKISLVMIVKNESPRLRRCLESVRPIIDEFVIVDTGSTDGTQAIIREYGELREIPFANYVDAKNTAISFATGDYILFMDADESIEAGLEFLKEHAETGTPCVNAKIIEGDGRHIGNTYFRPRLWQNDGTWQFVGPNVHEILDGSGTIISDHRILVRHDHSHRTSESYSVRFQGYLVLLNDYLLTHPDDARALFYLGRTHKDLGNYLDAITYYRRYLKLGTTWRDELWQAAHDIALCWRMQGEYDRALDACDKALAIDSRRAETVVLQGEIEFDLQHWNSAILLFERAAAMPLPTDVTLFLNPQAYGVRPRDTLVLCLDHQREYRRAIAVAEQLIDPQPDNRLVQNLTWLRKQAARVIFFTLGYTPEPIYGGMLGEQGVGGVETTYLELPGELTKLGNTVFVFCRTAAAHIHNGVYYVPFADLQNYATWQPDAIITSRWYEPFDLFPNAKKIIWMQDAHFADPNKPNAFQIAQHVVCSSPWHRQYIAHRASLALAAEKLNVIPLAVRGELFDDGLIVRDPLRVVYSSNPDRGLYELMAMWDAITRQVPGIELHITYGWDGLKTWSSDPAWIAQQEQAQARVENWAQAAGNVHLTGRLTKAALAREMLAASLCLYPNNFQETFCLTALETQMAGTPMITTRLGALATTLSDTANILIDHSPNSFEYQTAFIGATVELMRDSEKRNQMSDQCRAHAAAQPDWARVALQWERILWS